MVIRMPISSSIWLFRFGTTPHQVDQDGEDYDENGDENDESEGDGD